MSLRWQSVAAILVIGLVSFGGTSCIQRVRTGVLRIAVLPDQEAEQLKDRYTPLFEFISQEAGISYQLIIPESYAELTEMFCDGQVDLAYFGALTFLQANKECGAVPLAMREVDMRFTSYFIVAQDSLAGNIEDCRDMSFAFGSRLSTSGHLMPRHFLASHEITPEEFFSTVIYSGAHDRTAFLVRDRKVDVGAVNASIVKAMFESGQISRQKVRVLLETPPYPDYVWAASKSLAEPTRERIRNAFLKLSEDNPEHDEILTRLGTENFFPATLNDFEELVRIAEEKGMLDSE